MDSKNHHYIPKLYLKGFTSSSGKLRVYDKKYSNFKKDKQSPKTIFFEEYRNTIIRNGVKTNIIEDCYGILENQFGKYFNLVRENTTDEDLCSPAGLKIIKQYLAIQFWRLPIIDGFADEFVKKMDLNRYGNKITFDGVNIGEVSRISDLINEDSDFRFYFRCFVLPILLFDMSESKKEDKFWRIVEVDPGENEWDNILCSDYPIITENIFDFFKFEGPFVFPLSKTKLMIFSKIKNLVLDLDATFSTRLAMLTYAQTNRYIAGSNIDYISNIIDLYNSYYGPDKTAELKGELFSQIM